MKITTLQINLLLLSLMLLAMQAIILWLLNGELRQLILGKELDVLAIIFAPSGGLVWAARRLAYYQPDGNADQDKPCPHCGRSPDDVV